MSRDQSMEVSFPSYSEKAVEPSHQDSPDNDNNQEEQSRSGESLNPPQKATSQQGAPTDTEQTTTETNLPSNPNVINGSFEFLDFPAFPFAPRGRVNTPVSGGKPKPKPK